MNRIILYALGPFKQFYFLSKLLSLSFNWFIIIVVILFIFCCCLVDPFNLILNLRKICGLFNQSAAKRVKMWSGATMLYYVRSATMLMLIVLYNCNTVNAICNCLSKNPSSFENPRCVVELRAKSRLFANR